MGHWNSYKRTRLLSFLLLGIWGFFCHVCLPVPSPITAMLLDVGPPSLPHADLDSLVGWGMWLDVSYCLLLPGKLSLDIPPLFLLHTLQITFLWTNQVLETQLPLILWSLHNWVWKFCLCLTNSWSRFLFSWCCRSSTAPEEPLLWSLQLAQEPRMALAGVAPLGTGPSRVVLCPQEPEAVGDFCRHGCCRLSMASSWPWGCSQAFLYHMLHLICFGELLSWGFHIHSTWSPRPSRSAAFVQHSCKSSLPLCRLGWGCSSCRTKSRSCSVKTLLFIISASPIFPVTGTDGVG